MKILSFIPFVFMGIVAIAQVPALELKPIQQQGWKYYYDFKPVETPYTLQVPFMALNDDEVIRDFNAYKTLKKTGNLAWLFPGIVLLNGDVPPERFPFIVAGVVATNLMLGILAHRKMKRAVARYNMLILEKK